MKIIHSADIHLGSKLESKFPKDKSDLRKREVLNTFNRMVEFAKENDVKIILLSGDVFDKDKPSIKDKEYFYKVIKNNKDIDFIYLNGNHDKDGSYVENEIENLKTFNKDDIKTYEYDNIAISGIEMDPSNSMSFYSQVSLDKNKINILMLHGDATDSAGMDKVKIENLKNKNIDYLALGHIHTYKTGKIDERGVWAFSGCLEGRGFDEYGEKGFILLDINDNIKFDFIPFSKRTIYEVIVDVSGCNDLYDIEEKIKDEVSTIDNDNILRIILKGELPVGIDVSEDDLKEYLSSYFFVDIKDKTTLKIDAKDYESDNSLIGEFVKSILSNETYTDDYKQKLISLGLKLISGREVE